MNAIEKPLSELDLDIAIVGAGFAGLYALHRARRDGWNAKIIEAEADVGGTWYKNRYPGARCDVQSLAYCYSFDEKLHAEWTWSERYATQPEILRYLSFVADRLELRQHIRFHSAITRATFDETANRWHLMTADGSEVSAAYVIMATGALSVGRLPDIPGIESFRGETYHTGSWPDAEVQFSGKRVAVIGTGSSGVQIIPPIAKAAQHLTVFQRTPPFIAPARNAPVPAHENEIFRGNFASYRSRLRQGEIYGTGDIILGEHLPKGADAAALSAEERQQLLQARWDIGGMLVGAAFSDTMTNRVTNQILSNFFRDKIKEAVRSPELAYQLTPQDYPFGSKRVCVGSDYYDVFNRDNVTLIDVTRSPIEEITPAGVRTGDIDHPFDIIVFATGFDAITGALNRIDIRGVDGVTLREAWSDGPQSYLGIAVAGFPNLFTITGPGSPSVLGNVVIHIEQHVEWIADLLNHARDRGFVRIEAQPTAQHDWTVHVADCVKGTLYAEGKSWYRGANVPGKPVVFMPYIRGIGAYRAVCEQIAADDYDGFVLSS